VPYEQTIVVLGPVTEFTVICQTCAQRAVEDPSPLVRGTLRRDHDLAWTECPNGHLIRAVRAGRGVHAELTQPLW
jgi:hypothetical protein